MTEHDPGERAAALGRLWHVGAAAVVTGAVVGYFTATRNPPRADKPSAEPAPREAGRMPGYAEIGEQRRGPNADMYAAAVDGLNAGKPGAFEPVIQSEAERQAVILARAGRRAYDGAPPTIPHEVKQKDFPDCMACHAEGAKVAGKRAPRMSHARYDNCTQCHVPSTAPAPLPPPQTPVENEFAGLASRGKGLRAWPGAPPTIPHPTLMRSECSSCHGTGGPNGIRSTHPYRESCTQCHAGNAALDQRSESPPPWQLK
ncbi:MAG: nitrate reductase cytochrome c-type subunit [Myxococcales bacterium]|nr:nitrate reductase cytochrome c-type subunit [Myxococcales bacterium]